jgi:hypothetical protein
VPVSMIARAEPGKASQRHIPILPRARRPPRHRGKGGPSTGRCTTTVAVQTRIPRNDRPPPPSKEDETPATSDLEGQGRLVAPPAHGL